MEVNLEQWVNLSHNKYSYGKTIIAYSDMGRIKRLDGTHYKNGIKNQYTGGIKCGQ